MSVLNTSGNISGRVMESQGIPKGLPQRSLSICPVCGKKIWAEIKEKNDKMVIEKECSNPEHGRFEDILSTDPYLFMKAEKWASMDGARLENPHVRDARNCPEDCGLCQMHYSTPAQVNIDLTNRCNMKCLFASLMPMQEGLFTDRL